VPSNEVNYLGVLSVVNPKSLRKPPSYPLFRVTTDQLCPLELQSVYLKVHRRAGADDGSEQKLVQMVNSGVIETVRICGPVFQDGEECFQLFEPPPDTADPGQGKNLCHVQQISRTKEWEDEQEQDFRERIARALAAKGAKISEWTDREKVDTASELSQVVQQQMDRKARDQSSDGGPTPRRR